MKKTNMGGAGVAFATVVRLIWRACSRTLVLASTMDEVVERQRTKAVAGFFWDDGTRNLAAGRAIVMVVLAKSVQGYEGKGGRN